MACQVLCHDHQISECGSPLLTRELHLLLQQQGIHVFKSTDTQYPLHMVEVLGAKGMRVIVHTAGDLRKMCEKWWIMIDNSTFDDIDFSSWMTFKATISSLWSIKCHDIEENYFHGSKYLFFINSVNSNYHVR